MKKLLALLLVLTSLIGLSACGGTQKASTEAKKEIVIGASPQPHKEILEKAAELLEKEGYKLKIVEFTDYVTPNIALQDGDLDANFFQHIPYLETFNKEKNLNLDYTVKVHLEPLGLYSSKIKAIKELKDGAEIAIPNDPTNGSRALRVLEAAGLIKLKSSELVTKLDITENPKNIKINEIDAPQLPRVLSDVDAAIINTNYALEAKLNPKSDALFLESKDSPYANIIAVRKEDKDKDYIKALSKVLNSEEIKKFIDEKYNGAIIPAF